MPGDATVLKRFFHDNFVIFRRRSKRIAFLESVNFFTRVYMQIFNYHDGLTKGTPSESRFSIGTIGFGVKLFPVGCAQNSRRVP